MVVTYLVKINVTKFDGKGNFGLWRYEVTDVMCSFNLEKILNSDEILKRYLREIG